MENNLDLGNLSADVGPADLMAIAERYPVLFNTALVVMIVACIGYAIYWVAKKNKKPAEKPAE